MYMLPMKCYLATLQTLLNGLQHLFSTLLSLYTNSVKSWHLSTECWNVNMCVIPHRRTLRGENYLEIVFGTLCGMLLNSVHM